jgi:esterase/lipase superfamily enzyme
MSISISEQARFPRTPLPIVKTDEGVIEAPTVKARQIESAKKFSDELRRRLASTDLKEAYLFIHGYNDSFEDGAYVISELWHFLGRRGVPMMYSWPAGAGLSVRGYEHDRESGEFTIFHLKQFLRTVAACPELKKINIIAHSRGAHVATSALRELFIEAKSAKVDPKKMFKISHLVLASPDMDLDVTIQRLGAEHFFLGVERFTIYVTAGDKAIGFSDWLSESRRRVGDMRLADLGPEMQKIVAGLPSTNFISAHVKLGFVGHDYYRSNPAVSSDLILLLRDNRPPGAANGRPLTKAAGHYWRITDDYLKKAK